MSKTVITYRDISPGAARSAVFSGQHYEPFSHLAELRNTNEQENIVSLETNLWILNGTYKVLGNQVIPFWSNVLSDKNCYFHEYPTITIDFQSQYSSPGITFQFDDLPGTYCTELNVKWYRDGEIVADTDFFPASNYAICTEKADLYNRIEIAFKRTSLPFQRVRLRSIILGIIRDFEMDEIRSAVITNQVNLISAELPISTLDWVLDSKDDIDFMFQFKQPVDVKNDGFVIGVYYITDTRRTSRSVHNIKCQDAIGVLDCDNFSGGAYVSYSAKQLFTEIINDDFEIDFGDVPDINLTGVLPTMTKRAALQQVLFGWGACAATDGGELIRVFQLDDLPKEIGMDHTYTDVSVETSSPITALKVTAHKYTEDPNGSIQAGGKKYTDTQTIYTINNPDVTESTKANVMTVEGANFVTTENVAEVARRVYDYYTKRVTANVKIVWGRELLGDCVTVPNSWDGSHTGNIQTMNITLSNTVAADIKAISS